MAIVLSLGTCGCAGWERTKKNFSSSVNNGLKREIIVYDTVGNELYRQIGKFDVDYINDRILYDDEQGHRHSVYFKTGTVVVNEID